MPSLFAAIAADASAAVDEVYGEQFTLTGMLPVSGQNRTPREDPARLAFPFVGVWLPKPVLTGVSPHLTDAEDTAQKPGFQGQAIGVLVNAAILLWQPVVGDRVLRVDVGLLTSVTRILGRGHGRVAIMLAR